MFPSIEFVEGIWSWLMGPGFFIPSFSFYLIELMLYYLVGFLIDDYCFKEVLSTGILSSWWGRLFNIWSNFISFLFLSSFTAYLGWFFVSSCWPNCCMSKSFSLCNFILSFNSISSISPLSFSLSIISNSFLRSCLVSISFFRRSSSSRFVCAVLRFRVFSYCCCW